MNISIDRTYKLYVAIGLTLLSASAGTAIKIAYESHDAELQLLLDKQKFGKQHKSAPALNEPSCDQLSQRANDACKVHLVEAECDSALSLLLACKEEQVNRKVAYATRELAWLSEYYAAKEVLEYKLIFRRQIIFCAAGIAVIGLVILSFGLWRWHRSELAVPSFETPLPKIDV